MKKSRSNDIPDNKDNTTQKESTLKSDSGADSEKATWSDEYTTSAESEGEAKIESAKDSGEMISTEVKLAEMQDRYLRLSAEFDNYRKRTLREKIELTKNAGENILLSIIPVMDDFDRALKHMETAADCVAMKSGIDIIYNKFNEFLKQQGIKEIESLNHEFNVDFHEALTKVPVQDESMKGKVVDVIVKGYRLHDKVLRFSKVVVGE